jgi:YNFM family putative membrane transporter
VIAGIGLLTVGFFAAHSVASSWVGRRAQSAPAQATGLYLLAYYAGSTIAAPLGGAAWSAGGWNDVTALAASLLAVALIVALRLRATPRLQTTRPTVDLVLKPPINVGTSRPVAP